MTETPKNKNTKIKKVKKVSKSKKRKRSIQLLTIGIILIFLVVFLGIIWALVETIPNPDPQTFPTKWHWFFGLPAIGGCPWGLKILIFGGLLGLFFMGLTIAAYVWKKGQSYLYKLIYGEKIE